MAALPYRDLRELYSELKTAGVTNESMEDWASRMTKATKSDTFSKGVDANWLKNFSADLDIGLKHFASSRDDAVMRALGTPEEGFDLPSVSRHSVEQLVSALGGSPEFTGQAGDVGETLPRTATNILPLFAGGIGGLLGMAGLSGAETYEQTGSTGAGLTSAALNLVMPKVAQFGEQQLLKRIGGKLVEGPIADTTGKVTDRVSQYFPTNRIQGLKSQVVGQVAAAGLSEVERAGEAIFTEDDPNNPRSTYNFSPTEQLLNMTLGQLPFAGVYLTKHGRAGLGGETTQKLIRNAEASIDLSQRRIDLRTAKEKLQEKGELEQIPPVPIPIKIDPKIQAEQSTLLAQLRGEQIKVKTDPNLTDEQRVQETNKLLQQESTILRQRESLPTDPTSVFGDSIKESSPREQVVGRVLKETERGRAILVEDFPVNPEGLRGRVVWYSKAYEPEPVKRSDGTTVYHLPDVQWRTIRSQDEWNSRYPKKGDNTPQLPIQPEEATREQMFAHLADLQRVEDEAGQVETTGDLHGAVTRLQSIQDETGLPATTDVTLKKTAKQLQDSGLTDPAKVAQAAVTVEAKKTARKVSTRETERTVAPLSKEQAAEVSAMMDQGGFRIITADKLSHTKKVTDVEGPEGQPHKDLVGETAIRVSLSDDGQKAFNGWTRKSETSLQQEQQMFYHLTDEFGTLAEVTPEEGAHVLMDRLGMSEAEARDEFQDFVKRPHVQVWEMQLENELARMRAGNAAPPPAKPQLPAGTGWLFSMGEYDPEANVLNQKHKLPKDGKVGVAIFRNMAGVSKPLTEAEIQLYKVIVPEAFTKGPNWLKNEPREGDFVDVPKLWKGLKSKGPVVEIRKLGEGAKSPQSREHAEILHELDTKFPGWDNPDRPVSNEDEVKLRNRLNEIGLIAPETQGGQFSFLAPKPESEMPGYVEGLVRVGQKVAKQQKSSDRLVQIANEIERKGYRVVGPSAMDDSVLVYDRNNNEVNYDEQPTDIRNLADEYAELTLGGDSPTLEKQHQAGAGTRDILYRGPHFGFEDTNVLAFFRGYEETLPDGTKAFHVIEVQSDWGQRQRERESNLKAYESGQGLDFGPDHIPSPQEVKDMQRIVKEGSHPLLRVYESLALKAAIQHAKEVGATKVILSDAETAMMTEGHDRIGGTQGMTRDQFRQMDMPGVTPEESDRLWEAAKLKEPPQAKGMRLHYDQTLPSAMEKLTGVKGERVEVGVHRSAAPLAEMSEQHDILDRVGHDTIHGPALTQQEAIRLLEARGVRKPVVGSPVFRDASGNPKTQITGRLYDISNTPDAFTLTERNRAPEHPFVPEPEDTSRITELGIDKGGEGLRQFLLKAGDPFYRALGKDLEKFGPSLERITAKIANIGVGAHARNIGNSQVEIAFSPGILSAMDAHYYVAHELVHGLTNAELDNPTKAPIVGEITKLRQRLIDALPKDMRKIYDDAVKTNWYDRYARGEIKDTGRLSKDYRKAAIVYSLFTNHELVAQGLTDPHVRTFMQGVKSEGTSWFSRFTNVVKRLIGVGETISDTAFEEFLSKTDMLMEHSNHVNDLFNYSNRYFENLGYSQGLVNAQSRRAIGLVLDSTNGTTPDAMFASLQQSPVIRSTELIKANREVMKMLQEKGEDFDTFSLVMDELGHNVDMRGLNDFAYEALVNGENHDVIDLLPDSAAKYLFAQASDMADVIGVLKAASSEKNQGLINLTDAKSLRLPVNEAMKQLDKILSVSKMHDLAMEQMQGLFAVTPDGYMDKIVSDPVRAPQWLQDTDKTKMKVSWFKNFLQPTGQWAREDPRAGEIVAKGHQLAANSRKMASEGLKVFGLDVDQLDKGGNVLSKAAVDRMEKILKQPRLVKAVNDWMFLNQKSGQANGETYIRPASDPEVAKALQKLSQDERSQVSEIISKQQISMQMMHAQQLEKMLQIAASDGAVLIGNDTGLKTPHNVQLAQSLLEAAVVDRNNPLEIQAYIKSHGTDMDTQVALVQQRLQPEIFNKLLKYSLNEAQKHAAWKEFFGKNPAWASGQRYGKFLVEYQRGKRTFLAGVESRKEAEELAQGGRISKFESNRKYDDDSPPNLGPDAIGMITRLRELHDNYLSMMKDKVPPDVFEDMQRRSPVEQLATEEAYRGGVPNLRPPARGLRKGAEELPWLSNHFSWVQKTSSFWSRQLLRAQSRAYLLDPEISADREFQKRAKTHVDNILANDPELAQKFSKFTTTWFMGYNPASALINGTQSFVTHVAELTSLTGKPVDSYRRVLDAMNELKGAKLERKGFRGDEHEKLMSDAAKDGEIDYSMFDTDANAQESIETNYKRILNGQRTQTVGQYIGTAAGAYTKAGMWMFRGVEKLNNQIALLASYDYYREQGLDYRDAKAKAYEFNRAVNYGGGRAQRPVGAFSGRGPVLRGAAVTMTALQNYTLGTTFQIGRYLQRGFFRPEGTTPAERHNARIAATQMLATQLASAGVLGLPFVSGAIALLDKLFPSLELNKNLRESVASLFQSDSENGSVLADIAMTGVPSMFGWDLQSRLSMGNTVPGVSEVNGFQPELLAGPPANLIGNFLKGGVALAQGNLGGLQSFLPSALKKPAQVVAAGGTVKDYRNRPIFEPTAGETLGLSLGFQPKRLSDYNTAARIADNAQTAQNRSRGQERQTLAEEVLKGNFGTVRQTILAKAQDDKLYNPLEEVRAIARSAEDLTFPRDLRREGTKAASSEREKLLRSFNLPPNSVSEIDRLKFRWQIQQRLGLPSGSKAELQWAQVIDQLRQQHPNATRSELSRQADLLLRGVGRTLQELPE